MKEKTLSALAVTVLLVIGVAALALASYGQPPTSRFLLALFPLIVILFGVGFLRQSGLTMAVIGLLLVVALATLQFETSLDVALGASLYGFVKSFGISISVAATMLMIFLMRETGALGTVSRVIKQQVKGNEVQALYIGIGFGSFLTSLGVVTPALFPPLLIAMGFTPAASVGIAVLGYDPTTSFSLLSIPITLPAQAGTDMGIPINPVEFAFKIALFLPVISVGFAFAILWLIGRRESMRRGAGAAVVSGLTLGLACLVAVSIDRFSGVEYIPIRIVGILGGLCAMLSLHIYQRVKPLATEKPKDTDYPARGEILRSFSPWIILAVLAAIVSIPQVGSLLSNIPLFSSVEKVPIFADKQEDLNVFSQIYTWIFVAILLSLLTLRPSARQTKKAFGSWLKRFLGPFLTYSLYFSVSYVMAFSAMEVVNGTLTPIGLYSEMNMNVVLGATLAAVFGAGYIFVAASLGLFGAVVGGSETSSNVLFLKIQKTATENVGLDSTGFMTVYGSHAVAGGVASAVTPAKINNAVVTIDESHATESLIMRKHLVIAILLTIVTGVLTGILVNLGI